VFRVRVACLADFRDDAVHAGAENLTQTTHRRFHDICCVRACPILSCSGTSTMFPCNGRKVSVLCVLSLYELRPSYPPTFRSCPARVDRPAVQDGGDDVKPRSHLCSDHTLGRRPAHRSPRVGGGDHRAATGMAVLRPPRHLGGGAQCVVIGTAATPRRARSATARVATATSAAATAAAATAAAAASSPMDAAAAALVTAARTAAC